MGYVVKIENIWRWTRPRDHTQLGALGKEATPSGRITGQSPTRWGKICIYACIGEFCLRATFESDWLGKSPGNFCRKSLNMSFSLTLDNGWQVSNNVVSYCVTRPALRTVLSYVWPSFNENFSKIVALGNIYKRVLFVVVAYL